MLGRDWTKLCHKRHLELSVRFAVNIKKRARAGVNEEVITEYIENLKIVNLIGDIFVSRLKEKRVELSLSTNNHRKKLAVPPGQSINHDTIIKSPSEQTPKLPRKKGRLKQTADPSDSSSDEDDHFSVASSGNSPESYGSLEDNLNDIESFEDLQDQIQEPLPSTSAVVEKDTKQISKTVLEPLKSGDFVIVAYEDAEYPGIIVVALSEDGATVDCMKKGSKS